MKVVVEFGYFVVFDFNCRGGMDILFKNRKTIEIDCPFQTVQDLIIYLKDKELSERAELFVDGDEL